MGKFYVYNDLKTETVIVREGSGSTFFKVKEILPGQHYVVHVDSKATCREFLLVLLKEKFQEKITSDECLGYAEVRIVGYSATGGLKCERVPKIPRGVSGMTTDAKLSNFWPFVQKKILSVFGKGEKAMPVDAPDAGGGAPGNGSAPIGGSALNRL